MALRRKRWSGEYIIVWSDNSWEFFGCCRCGTLLNDTASRKGGFAPECKKRAALDDVWGHSGSGTQEDARLGSNTAATTVDEVDDVHFFTSSRTTSP